MGSDPIHLDYAASTSMRRGSAFATFGIASSRTPSLNCAVICVGRDVLRQRERTHELAAHALDARVVAVDVALLDAALTAQA